MTCWNKVSSCNLVDKISNSLGIGCTNATSYKFCFLYFLSMAPASMTMNTKWKVSGTQTTEAQLDPSLFWIPGQNRMFLKLKCTFWINLAMSPTLTEKQKDAPGNSAFFSFSAKVQNYAGLMQKVHFRLKNSILSRYPIVPSSSGSKCASDPSVPLPYKLPDTSLYLIGTNGCNE